MLDTTVLIAVERGTSVIDSVVQDEDDVAIAAITAAELLVGVHRAQGEHAASRRAFVESLLSGIGVEPYDLEVARAHAELLAHTRTAGRVRGTHDLIIAATARARSRTVVTADANGFEDLPRVSVRFLPTAR